MALDKKQIKSLKGQAHSLKPLVQVGKSGLSDAVIAETDRALHDHELIKIRIEAMDKAEFVSIAEEICEQIGAELVSTMGRTAIVYRASTKEGIRPIKP